ncbi:hypothetical protein BT69DRAFT_1326143 [Atractiella rhizophila]|nr:hypothetical protein BT69DRAFT_1326143 [Atractiella rhizophila]
MDATVSSRSKSIYPEWVFDHSIRFYNNLGRERCTAQSVWSPLSEFDLPAIQSRVTLEFSNSFYEGLPGRFVKIHMCFYEGQCFALEKAIEDSKSQLNDYQIVLVLPGSDPTVVDFGPQTVSPQARDCQVHVYLTPSDRDAAIVFGFCESFHLQYQANLPSGVPASRHFLIDSMARDRVVSMKLLSQPGVDWMPSSARGHLTLRFATMVPSPISYLSSDLLASIFIRLAVDGHHNTLVLRGVCKLWDESIRRIIGPITRVPVSILDNILDLATSLEREEGQLWDPIDLSQEC